MAFSVRRTAVCPVHGDRAAVHRCVQYHRPVWPQAAHQRSECDGGAGTDEHHPRGNIGHPVKGLKGWLKSFADPSPVIAPMNLLEVIIRPLSLCMRLFGNVLGAFVIMELIKQLLPVALPVPFSLYFDIFDGLLQAYVFTFLTSMFIHEKIN